MSRKKECIAMILAGGRGEKLGSLTNYMAKPTVPFGGRYKIIDFTLSNCKHSGIDTIGVLTQYFSMELHTYINNDRYWDLHRGECNVFMCPAGINKGYYKGTADAIYKNIDFIDHFSPENVLILSGDHVYKMDYRKMLEYHNRMEADVTIASTTVPPEDSSRYTMLRVNESGHIISFDATPEKPRSNLASMGIYLFRWSALKKYLIADHKDELSKNDFDIDILPEMFFSGKQMYAYLYNGYWRDVGKVDSLWEANMDLIDNPMGLNLEEEDWKVLSGNDTGELDLSHSNLENGNIVVKHSTLKGRVEHSIVYNSVVVGEGSQVINSIVLPNVYIGKNVTIQNAIIGSGTKIMDQVEIGSDYGTERFVDLQICSNGVSLISPFTLIKAKMVFKKNSHIDMASSRSAMEFNHSLNHNFTAHSM